ncbi:hypothetical protein EAO68_29310 [Streptomyces sp. wa22]|nr:hypothetical protein EAO68_29310 [Streptomyces sp. wa22]
MHDQLLSTRRGASRWNTRTKLRGRSSSAGRPAGGGGAGGESLGRSRGGLHQQDPPERGRPLPPAVPDRYAPAASRLHPVHTSAGEDPGTPVRTWQDPWKPDSIAADKAYSSGPCRQYLRRRAIHHTIPEKADSQAARLRKGSRGGRPPGFDEERYKKRNTLERVVNRPKNSLAVRTRYDKRGYVFLGAVTAAALVIRLRT